MKNICLFIFVILFYALGKSEDVIKNKNNQIGVSYGFFTFNSIYTGYRLSGNDLPYDYIINKDKYYRNTKEIPPLFGAINFIYKRYIKNKFVPNVNIVYSQLNSNFNNTLNNSLSFKTKDYTITIMPGFEYHYLQKKILEIYSGIQMGMYVNNQKIYVNNKSTKKTNTGFAFQINGIGISIGKKVYGFFELGFGFTSIVNIGISCKL